MLQNKFCFGKEIYDDDTEQQTGKDDCLLSKFIQQLKVNNSTAILSDKQFLKLVFKLFCRQPALNDSLVRATYNAMLKEPFLNCGAKNGLKNIDQFDFKRWVNAQSLLPGQNDISLDYHKVNYTFVINQTSELFVLPDNTKNLSLPLTPNILVKLDFNHNNQFTKVKVINKTEEIQKINEKLIENCDSYYISMC